MTTTAFQWIFNNAESINYNRKAVTAQTIARDNSVRSVSRGGQVFRFEVKLPDGMPWDSNRQNIDAIDTADCFTPGTVQMNTSGYVGWLSKYQGNSVNYTGFAGSWTQGSTTLTLTTSPTTTSGYKFRKGDWIQLGASGKVYVVTADVAYNSNTVTLHRPVTDATATAQALIVGPNVTWTVVCVQMPQWTIFARNQVSWSGPFVFYESTT